MQGPKVIPAARIARAGTTPSGRRLATAITFAAAILSLLLATALPTRADTDRDDIAKALIAAIVIGAIVNESRKDRDVAPVVPAPEPVHDHRKKKGKARIPAFCALEFEGERRTVTVYPESCLLDAGITRRLPYDCGREARIYGQWDTVFSERCLREAGFTLPDRRKGH